jgi:cytochrome bd ubiquinol oxidase subunit II
MAVVSLWTPWMSDRIYERWFSWPNALLLAPLPLMSIAAGIACWWALRTERTVVPFLASIALFLLGYTGLAISNAPYLVPPHLTVFEAAADPSSQWFMLVGTLLLLPFVLGYTAFVYWTFRGKVRTGEGYH